MPDISDRDRSIAAYAGEVRAFHTFFGAVLMIVALLHLFIWLPYLQLRDAAPALASAADATEQEVKVATEATRALEVATAALAQFRRALEAAPSDLHATIGSLSPWEGRQRARTAIRTG